LSLLVVEVVAGQIQGPVLVLAAGLAVLELELDCP
jgi:hypothetical protein